MVSHRQGHLTRSRRRAVWVFLVPAILVWWLAWRADFFIVNGLREPAASTLGPVLPAISAGLAAALVFVLVDSLSSTVAGLLAALVVVLLPGFIPMHQSSLAGPPLLVLTLVTLLVMVHWPRFSLAHGFLAGTAAVMIDPAGAGLPVAAVLWGYSQPRRSTRGVVARVALAALPALVMMVLIRISDGIWPGDPEIGWQGGLDRSLRSAGMVIGDQMAPMLHARPLRWFAIADMALVLIAVVAVAWRRVISRFADSDPRRRFMVASGLMIASLIGAQLLRQLLVADAADPGVDAVLPLVVIAVMVATVSVTVLWPKWPRWGKALALLLLIGWGQAAIRGLV